MKEDIVFDSNLADSSKFAEELICAGCIVNVAAFIWTNWF
jgi:hypothetical protein